MIGKLTLDNSVQPSSVMLPMPLTTEPLIVIPLPSTKPPVTTICDVEEMLALPTLDTLSVEPDAICSGPPKLMVAPFSTGRKPSNVVADEQSTVAPFCGLAAVMRKLPAPVICTVPAQLSVGKIIGAKNEVMLPAAGPSDERCTNA